MTKGSLQQSEEQSSTFLDFNLVILFLIHSYMFCITKQKKVWEVSLFRSFDILIKTLLQITFITFLLKEGILYGFFYIFMQEETKDTAVMQNHTSVHEFISSVKIFWFNFWVCVEVQFFNSAEHGQTHSIEL